MAESQCDRDKMEIIPLWEQRIKLCNLDEVDDDEPVPGRFPRNIAGVTLIFFDAADDDNDNAFIARSTEDLVIRMSSGQ